MNVLFDDLGQNFNTRRVRQWCDAPLSNVWCVAGWVISTVLFILLTIRAPGIEMADANVTTYLAWATAHGDLLCGYVNPAASGATAPPVYPLLAGALIWFERLGRSIPYAFTTGCQAQRLSAVHFLNDPTAFREFLRFGYLGWLGVMAGFVGTLRCVGRGRTRWEPLGLFILALVPEVRMPLTEFFHPQDLLSVGLGLLAIAAVLRRRWGWAGALFALACLTQQFALLIAVPTLVATDRPDAKRLLTSFATCWSIVAVTLEVVSKGAAGHSLLWGTGGSTFTTSLLVETGLRGPALFYVSRGAPLLGSLMLVVVVRRHWRGRLPDPTTLFALVATSLALRLLFEVNIWGYYFMAVTVMLAVLDLQRGQVRLTFLVWVLVTKFAMVDTERLHPSSYDPLPRWGWQLLLVTWALALALGPLRAGGSPRARGNERRRVRAEGLEPTLLGTGT